MWRCFVITEKKYYLVFKKSSNEMYKFDTVVATDGRGKVLFGKYKGSIVPHGGDSLYSNTSNISVSKRFFAHSNFPEEEIFNYIGGTMKNPERIYIEFNKELYNGCIQTYCDEGDMSLDKATVVVATLMFNIGDSIKYLVVDYGSTRIKKSEFEDLPKKRTDEFVCNELGIPYSKKDMSANSPSSERESTTVKKNTVTGIKIDRSELPKIVREIQNDLVGQDEALYTVLYNIYLNQMLINSGNEKMINSSKTNIILDGPTGTGKTLLLNLIAKKLSLPMVIRPVTSFSSTGYKGGDLESLLISLLDATGGDLELAEKGIIVLDEFDKLASKSDKDLVMKNAVQQELLAYIGGSKIEIEYNGKKIVFDTSKITFIGLGAFNNLRERKIQENEKKYKPSIGFSTAQDDDYSKVYNITAQDYIDEGLMRELVGRFTTLTSTRALTPQLLEKILNESEISPLKGLQAIGALEDVGVNITIDYDVVSQIASLAYDENFGARGLKTIFNNIKNVVLVDLLSGKLKELRITHELLNKSMNVSKRSY